MRFPISDKENEMLYTAGITGDAYALVYDLLVKKEALTEVKDLIRDYITPSPFESTEWFKEAKWIIKSFCEHFTRFDYDEVMKEVEDYAKMIQKEVYGKG